MTYPVEVPQDIKEFLEADARQQGQEPADFITGLLKSRYAVARNLPAPSDDYLVATNIEKMTFHPFDLEAMRKKSGLPPGRTREEIAEAAEKVLANADPAVIAEMTRCGLL